MTVDGMAAAVGSANVNNRSTQFDEEVNLVVHDPGFTAILDGHFDDDLRRSERLDLEEWRRRNPAQKVAETVIDAVRKVI
jgi:cardiolipin synthase